MVRDPFLSGRRIAWAAAAATAVAALATSFWIRGGAPGAGPFPGRVAAIDAERGLWTAAWCLRLVASVLLLAFLVAVTRSLTPGYPVLRATVVPLLAVATTAEGLAATFGAVVWPPLAARVQAGEVSLAPVLETLDAGAFVGSGFLGVGLLSVAGALVAHAAYRTPPFPRGLAVFSLSVWGSGLAAAGATLAGSPRGLDLQAFLFLPLLAIWAACVAATHFRPPAGAG